MDATGSFHARIWNALLSFSPFSHVEDLLRIETLRLCDVLRRFLVELDCRHRLRSSCSTRLVASSDHFLRSDTIRNPRMQVAGPSNCCESSSVSRAAMEKCDATCEDGREDVHNTTWTSKRRVRIRVRGRNRRAQSGSGPGSKGERCPIERTAVKGVSPVSFSRSHEIRLAGRLEGEDDPS